MNCVLRMKNGRQGLVRSRDCNCGFFTVLAALAKASVRRQCGPARRGPERRERERSHNFNPGGALATALLFFLCLCGTIPAADGTAAVSRAGSAVQSRPQSYASIKVAIPSASGMPEQTDPPTALLEPSPSPYVYYHPDIPAIRSESETASGAARPAEPDTGEPEELAAPFPMVLAKVGDQTITDQDVMREMWRWRGGDTLEWIIGKAILNRELARLGMSVSDAEVDRRLKEHLSGLAKAFPGVTNPDDLTMSAAGMRVEEYRERTVWPELALRKIMRSAFPPSDSELLAYFAERKADFVQPEEVRISQIFIAPAPDPANDGLPGPADWAAAERQILEIHAKLRVNRSEESFQEIARAYGAGGQSRWIRRGQLLRELEDAAFSMSPGSISSPLKSGMGYHIIRTEEKRQRKVPDFSEVRDKVREQYEEKRFALRAGEFMRHLREREQQSGGLVVGAVPDILPPPADKLQ